MIRRYAEDTSVSCERSKAEIERLVTKHGAKQFASAWFDDGASMIGFVIDGRQIRITLELPKREDFNTSPAGRSRRANVADAAWEQACRVQWRALALVVKAKLEAVQAGISTIETEFLAFVVIPKTGKTFGEWASPQIEAVYSKSGVPQLLPGN